MAVYPHKGLHLPTSLLELIIDNIVYLSAGLVCIFSARLLQMMPTTGSLHCLSLVSGGAT